MTKLDSERKNVGLKAKEKRTKKKYLQKTGKKVKCKAMICEKSLPLGEKSNGEDRRSRKSKADTFTAPTTPMVVVLREGDAWLVGVGKRAPHGFHCLVGLSSWVAG